MKHESKFSTSIRSGGQSTFALALNGLVDLETKLSVVPDRLLDSIIDDALVVAVGRLNQYLPISVSIDISAGNLPEFQRVLLTFAFRRSDFAFIDVAYGPVTAIALADDTAYELADQDMLPPIRVRCLNGQHDKTFEFFAPRPN